VSWPVTFRVRALADIDEAYRWYEQQHCGLGATFMAEIEAVEALMGQHPKMFPQVRAQVRRAMLHKFPYGVFYLAQPTFVSVIAVLHHARDPKHWQRRARIDRSTLTDR